MSPAAPTQDDPVVLDLRALLAASERQNSKRLIERELDRRREAQRKEARRIDSQHAAQAAAAPPKPILLEKSVAAAVAAPQFKSITHYAWDQTKKWVKVYVTLPGLEALPDEQVQFSATSDTLRLEVTGLPAPASNCRLLVSPLFSTVEAG